jgi:hypothetical protein
MTHLNVFEQPDMKYLLFFLVNLLTMAYVGRSVGGWWHNTFTYLRSRHLRHSFYFACDLVHRAKPST